MTIPSIHKSNDLLTNALKESSPFMLTRPGIGGDTFVPINLHFNKKLHPQHLHMLQNNAGIYFRTEKLTDAKDRTELQQYTQLFINSLTTSKFVGCFTNYPIMNQMVYNRLRPEQKLHSRILEPFYLNSTNTWLEQLRGKKVLLISPFAKDMIKQIPKLDQIWSKSNFRIPKDIEWIPYTTYMTLAGNKLHQSWKETFLKMTSDISKLEFDVALLSCGGYGTPLCQHIYHSMKKTPIYVGGGLQIWFGIKGKRWLTHDVISKYMNEHWIFPTSEPNNKQRIEGGCYWK